MKVQGGVTWTEVQPVIRMIDRASIKYFIRFYFLMAMGKVPISIKFAS